VKIESEVPHWAWLEHSRDRFWLKKRAGLRRPFVVEVCGAFLWLPRNGTVRAERGRTSVVEGGVRADVVREGKHQGSACIRGDRPLGGRAPQRRRRDGKRATAG